MKLKGAHAIYIAGAGIAFISDEPTVSDVLEEMYHAEQDRKNMFGAEIDSKVVLLREIDAQKYFLSVAEKYKIPEKEIELTKQNLIDYQNKLDWEGENYV